MRWISLCLLVAACGGGRLDSGSPGNDGQSTDPVAQGGNQALGASWHGGMGAIPHDGGVTFRVWAPNAAHVFVKGDFNDWNPWGDELASEGNGNFSAFLGFAKAGHKYRFVIQTWDGQNLERNDPRAQWVENSIGAGIVHDPAAYWWNSNDFHAPGFNEQVIYEMHIGTFNDSPGFGPGNWRSAIDRLDHLASLGVNMVDLMPVMEFAGDFSWGYNVAYPFAPESAYGSPEDMKAFVDAAHERGIGVIVDVVANHWGPSDLPMWCFDGPCFGKGGIYFYSDWRAETPWGNTRPDYGRPEVREYIKDQAMMLLHEYRVDGLRWDSPKLVRTTDGNTALPDGYGLLQWLNDTVDGSQPWKIMIGEDFGGAFVTRSTGSGGAGFDSQWAGEFVHPIRRALVTMNDQDRNLYEVRDAIAQSYNGQPSQRVIYTESHDEVANGRSRVPEEIWPGNAGSWASKKRSTLGAALVMTSPGIPMIFQGQEFLEDGWFTAEDPLDWEKSKTFGGIIELYRRLIQLRRNFENNTRGLRGDGLNIHHLDNDQKLLAFHRWQAGGPGDDVVVVANFSGAPRYDVLIGFPRCGLWRSRFNSDWSGYSGDFGNTQSFDSEAWADPRDGMPCQGRVTVGPYSAVIFSQ